MSFINDLKNLQEKSIYSLFIMCFGLIALFIAYYWQYALGFIPCELCYYERIPFWVIFIASCYMILNWSKAIKYYNIYMYIVICALVINCSLALFHALLENGIIKLQLACTGYMKSASSPEEMMKIINAAPLASCSAKSPTILSFSMTGWNFFTSLILLFTLIIIKSERFDYKFYYYKAKRTGNFDELKDHIKIAKTKEREREIARTKKIK